MSLQLRLLSSSYPYYSEVWLRVSGLEFEPVFIRRSGPFYPGDRVVFEVNIPIGKERHIEAVILDPEGKPAYYGKKALDLYGGVVVMDMLPTQMSLEMYEGFLDGKAPVNGVEVFLLSEDLYSLNMSATGGVFWVGSYIAYRDDRGWRFHYLDAPQSIKLSFSKYYQRSVDLPEGEETLELYGSYVGSVSKGDSGIKIESSRLLLGGVPVLAGVGKRLYYLVDGSFKPACELFECRNLNLSISAPNLDTYRLFISYMGLDLPAKEGNRFVYIRGLPYRLRLEGGIREPCRMDYRLWVDLGEDFSGEPKVQVKTKRVRVEGISPNAYLRIYSKDLELGGYCESSARDGILVPYVKDEDLWVEASYPNGLVVGMLLRSGQETIVMPEVNLRVEEKLSSDVLTFVFERIGFSGWCSLELLSGEKKVYIDRIPPWRSHIKLKTYGYFEKAPNYRLRCERDYGYVEKRSFKRLEVF